MPSISYGTDLSKKSYITTEALNGHVYTYSRTYDAPTYTWSGSLTAIDFTAAPFSTYNVAGIVLRETGKKLYAGANPGVDRYMVGVFIVDQEGYNVAGDLGSMFIDPNCSVFAQFNGQRPTYIPTAEDDLAGNGLDLGNPVYTRGNITTTDGNIVASSTANGSGSLILGGGSIGASVNNAIAIGAAATADNQIITAGGVSAATSLYAGQNLYLQDARIVGQTTMVGGTISGGFIRKVVSSAAITLNSRIFLTNASINNAGTAYSAEIIAAGSFNIVSNNTADASTINWLVIN